MLGRVARMTDLVASSVGLFASELGNDESPQANSDVVVASSNNDGDAKVAAATVTADKYLRGRGGGGGRRRRRVVDEEEVIHYAAAAEELLATTALEMKKKKVKKVKKKHNATSRKGPVPADPPPPPPPEQQQQQQQHQEEEEKREKEQQRRPVKKLSAASVAATTAAPTAPKKDLAAEAPNTAATTTTAHNTTSPAKAGDNTASLAKEGDNTTSPAKEGDNTTPLAKEGQGETVYPEPPDKKKRRKKKNRQTSQEEESAQALLALNKGRLGSPGGAAEQAAVDGDGDGQEAAAAPSKKRKLRSRAHRVEAVVEARREGAALPEKATTTTAPAINTNPAGGDVDMADALSEPLTNAPTATSSSIANGNDSDYATDPSNALIPHQRIITEHLAAHMAKIGPPPSEPQPEDVLVEQRLMTELSSITQQTTGADGFMAVNHAKPGQKQPSGPNANGKKKRRRQPDSNGSNAAAGAGVDSPMSGLVDPQLMQLDHDAALAAGDTLPGGDPNPGPRKRRRATNAASAGARPSVQELEDGGQVPIDGAAKEVNRRKAPPQPGEARPSWSTAPVTSATEPINGGTFSLEERHTIDKALADYCKIQSMTMDELKDRVWGNNRRKDEFWDTICLSVPNRSRASVYKHVRRSCHIFQQRAKWSAEEDDELAELVKEKGNRWKDIGEAMGRMGEDCRDRYRNYVKCGKSRGTDRWTEEEEELLKKVVREHKEQARQDFVQKNKPLPPPDEEDAVLINWTTVSEMMQNKRSRIQCRYKWKKMLVQKEKVKQAPIGVTYVGGKKKRLTFDVKHMLPGDRQWLLHQYAAPLSPQVRDSNV